MPQEWSIGIIVPIYKGKGEAKEPDNYRGITLLSCISKLLTTVINNRLNDFVNDMGILGEEQAGFRKHYSTNDHIFSLQCIIDIYLNVFKKKLYCCFVDYKKAFDTVNRTHLWQTLLSYNINGCLLNLIKNMYSNAKSCIRLNNKLSDFFACETGVRQGENLSPLLFALYLNDLETFLGKAYNGLNDVTKLVYNVCETEDTVTYLRLFVLLYADDTILLAESAQELQAAINGLNHYCKIWDLTVNADKTKIMIFSKGRANLKSEFWFNGNKLEIAKEYKYLGIYFKHNGNFNRCINHLVSQAEKAMFSLITKARKLNLDLDVVLELFDKTVTPILYYGCEVWGFSNIEAIEKLHRRFCKIILKVNKYTVNCMILGELGRFPLKRDVSYRMLNFWSKFCADQDSSKLSSLFFNVMCKLDKSKTYSCKWITYIKNCLNDCNLYNLWLSKPVTDNLSQFKKQCKDALDNLYKSQWSSNCMENGKCISYKHFKTSLCLEKYLLALPANLSITLCKFRISCHSLPIEKGRHLGIIRSERLCHLCKNDIGDEYHYLLECTALAADRSKYVHKMYHNKPSMLKFVQLMKTDSQKTLLKLAIFVKIILNSVKN